MLPFETCKFITNIYCLQLISNMSRSNVIIPLKIVNNNYLEIDKTSN